LIGVGQVLTWKAALAPLAPPAMWAFGAAGLAVGWRRLRDARPDWWAVGAAAGAYLVLCAPVLLAFRPTFGGYLLDTTAGIQLVGAELLVENGRDFSAIPDSALRGALEAYLGGQYPSGGHVLLGGIGRPFPVSLLWLYEPYLAVMAAMSALPLTFLLRRGGAPRWLAAAGAIAGAAPALVYAYVQQGSIKEITALPLLLMLGCLLVLTREMWRAGPRGTIPFAVVGAGGIGAIGLAFSAWLGLVALAALAVALFGAEREQRQPRAVALRVVPAAVLMVVLAIPTFASFSEAFGIADQFDQGNALAVADPGNLLRPLLDEQAAGIWLTGTHRLDPGRWFQETYILIGIALGAALLGIGLIVRRRLVEIGAFVAACLIVWWVLTRKGTVWTDAKLLVLSSPVLMLLAFLGAANLMRGGLRAAGAGVAVLLVGGVLLSDALTYHETNLAPTDRFDELLDIGEQYAGRGPTLVPDFDEYAFYALRDMAPDGPGFASRTARLGVQVDGAPTGYGHSYDLDSLPSRQVQAYPLIVMRRSPERSRPPSGFVRVFRGDSYEVWQRRERPHLLVHEPGGGDLRPDSVIRCAMVRGAARRAGADGSLRYPLRSRTVVIAPAHAEHSPSWPKLPDGISTGAPGDLRARFQVRRPGRHLLWFKGEFSRPIEVSVDGRRVGEVAYETGGEGSYARPLEVSLDAGSHSLELTKGGGTLHPGDAAPSRLLAIVVQPVDQENVTAAAADRWRPLCEEPLDWLEAVKPGSQPLARVP
jgi:hypothetical protein